VALCGILRAGLTVVSVNPLYTARELEHQLNDSSSTAIVIFESGAHTLQAVLAKTPIKNVIITTVGDMLGLKGTIINFVLRKVKKMVPAYELPQAARFADVLAASAGQRINKPALAATDIAFLQYTGGTTGVSKGAALSHRNVVANVECARVCGLPILREGEEICITALPMYHIAALVLNGFLMLRMGGKQILIANPRDIPALIKTLAASRFSFILAVNTRYNALVNNPNIRSVDFSNLKLAAGGAAAIQAAVADRWREISGKVIIEGYGLTECSGAATIVPMNADRFTSTVGIPLPGTNVEIRDDAGQALPPGQAGQIFIHGPHVMTGYWQRPDETAKVLGADGFLATGDVGVMDDKGYIKIVDRVKDMILVSGFNVYPNEVEDVVAKCAGVLEAAAVGVADESSGEAVKIFVVKKDPALTAEQVLTHCKQELTGYKMPRHVQFIDALPKTPVGKVLRRELRDKK
jgi:long-chain acyl-CoA synthetase